MKPLTINCKLYSSYFTKKTFSKICSKFPFEHQANVIVQQENASKNVTINDSIVVQMEQENIRKILLAFQQPNPFDFIVLNLWFLNSIQSENYNLVYEKLPELVQKSHQSFRSLSKETLNTTFITFRKVMDVSLNVDYRDIYKMHHMGNRATNSGNELNHVVEYN